MLEVGIIAAAPPSRRTPALNGSYRQIVMSPMQSEPSDMIYALRDPLERERRIGLLRAKHMAPLSAYVDQIRNDLGYGREVPYFDPLDGGINASMLLLLEAPGPKAVASGFVSRNNPDPSARNLAQLLAESGVPREATLLWNIVPWYVGDRNRIRPVSQKDIHRAVPLLRSLRPLLPRVRVVVLVGRKAERSRQAVEGLFQVPVLACPHPSQRVLNVWPEKRKEITSAIQQATEFLLSTQNAKASAD